MQYQIHNKVYPDADSEEEDVEFAEHFGDEDDGLELPDETED